MKTKPGMRTTEFWITAVVALAGPLITFLISAEIFTPEYGAQATIIVANIVSLLAAAGYTKARSDLKIATDDNARDKMLLAERIAARAAEAKGK